MLKQLWLGKKMKGRWGPDNTERLQHSTDQLAITCQLMTQMKKPSVKHSGGFAHLFNAQRTVCNTCSGNPIANARNVIQQITAFVKTFTVIP
jgi:hypothetical protein